MKDRIARILSPKYNRYYANSNPIILIDWKNITNEALKVHSESPVRHPETGEIIKGVVIDNASHCNTHIDAFLENALNYSKKRRSKQCECIVYPDVANTDEWILFIETKYANNIYTAFNPESDYPNYAISQIKETVQYFRDKGIIEHDKIVNAIISFPQLSEAFNSFVFRDDESILDIFLKYRIIIRATNYIRIINNLELELVAD